LAFGGPRRDPKSRVKGEFRRHFGRALSGRFTRFSITVNASDRAGLATDGNIDRRRRADAG
jgi:hypothetical protein